MGFMKHLAVKGIILDLNKSHKELHKLTKESNSEGN